MNQIVHLTKTLAISTIEINSTVAALDQLTGFNPQHASYESIVFNLIDDQPDFNDPIEVRHYDTEEDAQKGHQELINKYDPQVNN